jgi:outer membrane protein insertion porin family
LKTSLHNLSRGWNPFLLFLVGIWCIVCQTLYAQTVEENLQQEPIRIIKSIEFEFGELNNVGEALIRSHLILRENDVFDKNLLDRSIRTLNQTHLFDEISVDTIPLDESSVNLIFHLNGRYRIQSFQLIGNDKVKESTLRDEIQSDVGQVLDERIISADREKLLTAYREKGFTQVKIEYSIDRTPTTGFAKVKMIIEEGPKLRIKDIRFEGNNAFKSKVLRKQMETVRWWMFSWLTGSGRFDESKFQEDLDKLRNFYREEGFLDVNISEASVRLEYPKKGRMVIVIPIDEGRRYRVGQITIEGNKIFETIQITRSLYMIPGDVFSPKKLEEDREAISDLYGSVGYIDARILPLKKPNILTGRIDLTYKIIEGEKYYLESIDVDNNTKTRNVVILRELALTPGRVFNQVWMKNSEARLKNTGFFEEVHLTPESTNIPGRRNLKVQVTEGKTGQFQVGAGYSSLEKMVVYFELSQGNFDITNWRSFFQGDGQKFLLKASVGSSTNEVVVSFDEPWVREQRLAFGIEFYRRSSSINSSYYDEVRTGMKLSFRKRLFELIDGQLIYNLEYVNIDNVFSAAPDVILAEAGERTVSKVSFNLQRDTRNDFIFTTNGAYNLFSVTYAGIGGDTDYIQLESRNSIFIPLFQTGDQVLSILARAGSFWEYNDSTVPFFDRFFLGGPNTLRGFEYRDVSPRTESISSISFSGYDVIGGNAYAFTSFEYTVKIGDVLRLAVFYDWGFVNERDFDFNPNGYNDDWGFGLRLLVLGNPLRLDYAFPLKSYNDPLTGLTNDRGGQLNFSFGTRF